MFHLKQLRMFFIFNIDFVKISRVNMQQKNQDKMEFERELLFFASFVKVGKIIGQFIALQIRDIFKIFVQSTVLWIAKIRSSLQIFNTFDYE